MTLFDPSGSISSGFWGAVAIYYFELENCMFYGLFGLCELGMSLFLFEISEQFKIYS